MSGGFNNQPILISINVCLFYFCVLFILLCSVFVFNFVFTIFHYLHSFVSYFCISTFKHFIFCVLLYLYDLRIFPMLFFFNLSTSLIRPSSLTTVHSLILPFFLVRSIPVHGRLTYFFSYFLFLFLFFLPPRLKTSTSPPTLHPFLHFTFLILIYIFMIKYIDFKPV